MMSLFYDIAGGNMTIIEQLNQLGLNGRQARVYLALLQLGSATAIEIAKYTKYKHPTVYDVLDLLKEKRLITETLSGKRKIFSAPRPGRLYGAPHRISQPASAAARVYSGPGS